jgi:hypothetical protein
MLAEDRAKKHRIFVAPLAAGEVGHPARRRLADHGGRYAGSPLPQRNSVTGSRREGARLCGVGCRLTFD